jgi:hypothetical protein
VAGGKRIPIPNGRWGEDTNTLWQVGRGYVNPVRGRWGEGIA